jgi:hypothetical protein
VKEYLNALDGFLQMEGKLGKYFLVHPKFIAFFDPLVEEEPVNFEDMYAVLTKWAISEQQTDLDYEDFAAADLPQPIKTDQKKVEDFKKMTDRVV